MLCTGISTCTSWWRAFRTCELPCRGISQSHEHLPGVGTLEHVDEGLGRRVEAIPVGLVPVDLVVRQPLGHLLLELRTDFLGVLGDDETPQRQPLADGQPQIARGTRRLDGVVLGDRPTHGHATIGVEVVDGGLQVVSPDVVVVDVDAVRPA